jgi:hypothetical protein
MLDKLGIHALVDACSIDVHGVHASDAIWICSDMHAIASNGVCCNLKILTIGLIPPIKLATPSV